MIEKLKKIKSRSKRSVNLDFLRVYQLISIILVPVLLIFLLFKKHLQLDLTLFHEVQLIYTLAILVLILLLRKINFFRKNFLYVHYALLFGIMLINTLWYMNDTEDLIATASMIVSANLIGIALINPKVTTVFYVLSLSFFTVANVRAEEFASEIGLMLFVTAIVITAFSFWKNQLNRELSSSKETFQGIFDYADQQIYVLSPQFEILDLSKAAEVYLKEHGIKDADSMVFQELFIAETAVCRENFEKAALETAEKGHSKFNANCAIAGSEDYVPKEFNLRKGKYFNHEVYILNVRIVKEQRDFERELLAHKDNVTQILENINYFVFNITFDKSERFKHHVNFVSSKVNDVYGYSVDEYIALVKVERIDKDRHPDDKENINKKFDELLEVGGKNSWRFRMKVKGQWRCIEEKIFVEKLEDSQFVSLFGMVQDVTEEIEAEELLKESEQRYRQIFETNLAGVFRIHINGEILDCNPAFANILGYDSVDSVKKLNVEDIYFKKSDRVKYIAELKQKKGLNNYTSILKKKNGSKLIINNNVSLLEDLEGNLNIIVGTVVDVTNLHETSIALKDSEEKYRLLFEESNTAILLVNIANNERLILDANQMARDLLKSNLLGLQLEDLLLDPKEAIPDFLKIEKALSKGEKTEKEWAFTREDKSSFFAEVSFAPVVMNNTNVAQLVIKDISERKQYEKEILESRLSFKNIVDKSPASILIFSEKGGLSYVNPNGEDLFLNVLNSKDRNLYHVFPEEKHDLINDLIREAQNDINSYTEIELGQGKGAKRYSINVVNTVYNFESSNLFILQDISLQTEYNIQKLRAEMAEETNVSLQEEIRRHKRTQLSLMESTSRLKALFESAAHLYIISIDKEYNLVSHNQNFKEMILEDLGIEVENGMNFLNIFPIEDYAVELIIKRFQQVLDGSPSNLISKFESLKGEVWMESFLSPILIEGQEVNEISFISHNITEQIEIRRRILDSEENNKALLIAIPDVLFKANSQGVFTDYRATSESNRVAFSRFTKSDKIKGKKIKDVLINKKVAEEIEGFVKETLKQNKLITHNFTVNSVSDEEEKIHYENRYSKVNDDEVVIISRNVTSTVEYEEKLIESVKEKEVLLKEVHHRVKNNLQVINSILNLQSSYVTDEDTLQIIVESQNRIRSMSYIHESLYQTKDFSSINFQDYITNLIQNLVQSYEIYSDETDLDLKVDSVQLALDQAIPCGLILNELITNALKYAYPNKKGGKITIEVYEKNGKVTIRVQDFGVGLPKDFDISKTDTLGLSLVDTLIDQIDGELKLQTKNGTEFLIIFEKQEI
jgi:PAS domain S-box-containing protein